MERRTKITIDGDDFLINGSRTYAGRIYNGRRIGGLLMNSRMVQAAFDDLNPETRAKWAYPDGPWDPERNTGEFVDAMPRWRDAGLLAFTVNIQGGSPEGYSKSQPWHNSGFDESGRLRPAYVDRFARIIDRADELGMVVILGFFYFGQDERLDDEASIIRATDNATDWILDSGYTNVLVEIANEVDVARYEHEILAASSCHRLINRVKERSAAHLLVSTSMKGGSMPTDAITAASDFLLLHGNGVKEPERIRKMVRECKKIETYRGQPIVFNEDDHFDFDKPDCNMLAAVDEHASWGFFDYRMAGEGYDDGYQSPPVNWGLSSDRKRGFFRLLSTITGEVLHD